MSSASITTIFLQFGLALIMFSLGLGLKLHEFRDVLRYPRAFSVGLLCHYILLPLVTYGVIFGFNMSGALAVGCMIVASCPTSVASNLLVYHAKGEVALGVSFTATSAVVSIVTVPLILTWSLQHFMGLSQLIEFPYSFVVGQLFVMVGLPVGLGLFFNFKSPDLAKRLKPKLTMFATLTFVLIVLGAVLKHWAIVKVHFLDMAVPTLIINSVMLLIGFFITKMVGAPTKQAATVAIDSSVQNVILAIVIAQSILNSDLMAMPAVIYGIVMYLPAILFVFVMRLNLHAARP